MDNTWIYVTLFATLVGTAAAVTCHDCWYHTVGGALGDDNCNTKEELNSVDNKTCNGECYTVEYTLGFGVWVERGCDDPCENGPYDIKGFGNGKKVCCTGDFCNDKIIISSAYAVQASAAVSALAAAITIYYLAL